MTLIIFGKGIFWSQTAGSSLRRRKFWRSCRHCLRGCGMARAAKPLFLRHQVRNGLRAGASGQHFIQRLAQGTVRRRIRQHGRSLRLPRIRSSQTPFRFNSHLLAILQQRGRQFITHRGRHGERPRRELDGRPLHRRCLRSRQHGGWQVLRRLPRQGRQGRIHQAGGLPDQRCRRRARRQKSRHRGIRELKRFRGTASRDGALRHRFGDRWRCIRASRGRGGRGSAGRCPPGPDGWCGARHWLRRGAHFVQSHVRHQRRGLRRLQMRRGIKDLLTMPAAHPSLGNAQLVRNDLEHRRTGWTAGDLAHGLWIVEAPRTVLTRPIQRLAVIRIQPSSLSATVNGSHGA